MRLTIERMRTLVLAAGVLLVVVLGVFLAIGRFRSPFSRKDIPKRLGIDIEQEANGVTYTQAHGGHTLFKIHASKVVQLKNDHALLHDVQIELYGADGSRVDRIAGNEFEYDQKDGTATATGPVEITLMRPDVAPAIAPKAAGQRTTSKTAPKGKENPLAAEAAGGEIHVKTSGLTFNQQSQVATTDQRVDFSMRQGSGSAVGATYDSQRGFLSLNHQVVLKTQRGADPVEIRASYADFDRDSNVCDLSAATAEYRGGQATAADAKILFREDGTAQRLYAMGGFTLATATGSHLAAPRGTLEFDEHNEPRHGRLEGGVTMDSVADSTGSSNSGSRTTHGTSPAVEIEFTGAGQLHALKMEQGVELASEETGQARVKGAMVAEQSRRTWRSPSAHVEFRDAGKGQVEPASIEGDGGVVLTAMERRGDAAASESRLSADVVTGVFGSNSTLKEMTGVGHASMEQAGSTGTHDTATGDRLDAHFAQVAAADERPMPGKSGLKTPVPGGAMAGQVESAMLDGHVTLTQQPAAKPGAPQPQPEMHATAAHAVYQGEGQWLHLSGSPRVVDGAVEMTADRIDVTQESGDAFAHGDVKATWMNLNDGPAAHQSGMTPRAGMTPGAGMMPGAGTTRGTGMTLGGQGPAHVVAAEAELHQSTGVAIFKGDARLWQQVNSVSAPVIEIDRRSQTLTAESKDRADPVRAVLVSAAKVRAGRENEPGGAPRQDPGKPAPQAVIRVRGGELRYSDAERRARMGGGVLGVVTAETGTATTVSQSVDLELTPAAAHANGQSQVARMTATGHVVVSSQGRRGAGEQLVYTGADGHYVLTGTQAAPPEMTDPERGSVTGQALIFDSRDDSVSIEGGTRETRTETTAPK